MRAGAAYQGRSAARTANYGRSRTSLAEMAGLRAVSIMEGRGPWSLRSGLRPEPGYAEAERRASDELVGRIADSSLAGTFAQGRGRWNRLRAVS